MVGLLENVTAGELLKAQAHVWNYSFNYIVCMSLRCAVELGVPDTLHRLSSDGPTSLSTLIAELPLHDSKTDALRRLMRLLSHSGFFTTVVKPHGSEPRYSLTTSTKLLLSGGSGCATPYVLFKTDPKTIAPWGMLSSWFLMSDNPVPYEAGNDGATFWECLEKDPDQKKMFYDMMFGDSVLVAEVLLSECKEVFEGVGTLVDVGGATGALSAAIAKALPDVTCVVFDLPHVVEGLKNGVEGGNLKVVGGSMLEDPIPPADAVILKWILHDWDDERSVKILKNCREAVSCNEKKGKVIIIDMVVGSQEAEEDDEEIAQVQLCYDMLMMASFNGKERNQDEWKALFAAAGFSDHKIVGSLGARSIIEAYP